MDESLLLRWRKGRAGELDPEERARPEPDISFIRTTAA
jgi:hypothetical protein